VAAVSSVPGLPRIRTAASFKPADRANGHVVVAHDLTRQTHSVSPFASSLVFSARVMRGGSPLMNSTRHVVQRALPPQACSTSTLHLARSLVPVVCRSRHQQWKTLQRSASACALC
jgi:hypothetical protein